MCHHSEIAEWEEIRERLDEPAEEPADEPAVRDGDQPEPDDERPEVPTPSADD